MKLCKEVVCCLFCLFIAVVFIVPAVQAALDELPLELLETPTEAADLVDLFSRLEFTMVATEEGEMSEEIRIEYQYEGVEDVNGVLADKISFHGVSEDEQSPMYFWLDKGELVQVEIEGQKIPGEMAGMMSGPMFQFIFFPFYFMNQIVLDDIEAISVREVSRSQGMVGDLEVEMIEIEVDNTEEAGSGFLRLAEYEDLLMVTGYEFILNGDEFRFEVVSLELR